MEPLPSLDDLRLAVEALDLAIELAAKHGEDVRSLQVIARELRKKLKLVAPIR